MLPPGLQPRWDDLTAFQQAEILAYDFLRTYDESEAISKSMPKTTPKAPPKAPRRRK